MRILLTGAGGQLGRELKRSLACLGDVTALDRAQLDLSQADALVATVRRVQPTVIINAAAYTAVDRAETNADAAMAINATAPGFLALEAKRLDALLIHYSTDYVFDGEKSTPYSEDDAPAPLSVYGRSKRDGEHAIQSVGGRHLILRTSWVFGLHGANFMKTMLRLGKERDVLRIVDDQIGAPTWSRHLADLTTLILARHPDAQGLYHAAAAGETHWCGYAQAIFDEAQRLGLADKIPTLHAIPSAEYPLPAPRPKNSRLDCSRLAHDFDLRLPDWRTGLADCLADAHF
jgi:dTDP-4-dehydrorhamnose reductase